jgi:YidC/Oxa1 family membrane protein insertase
LAWINRFAIIPIFNWLGSFISNFGIVILLLTIILKLVLFPLTYKSYVSSAKMRVLKPQIDEINAKIPKEKAMERQQATMALYRKVGVNPMGGCLPMLLQFPILIAMYRFFPASIELRQKAFLWTNDLSSYDSIWNLPFNIPMYGNHVSLFTILMAISMIFSTKISSNQMQGANAQMPGMKMMMYMMPVMMLVWFNQYSSGLSYYYFLTNIITIGQTLIIRRFVDDEAVLKKISENKKKPVTKSKFQQRLEEMAKQRSQQKTRGKK